MINENSVGVILYYLAKSSPQFLLLKYKIHGQTHWDFIKGKIEKRETLEETAIREAFEETKIKRIKTIKGFREEAEYNYQKNTGEKTNKKVIYFLSKITKKESEQVKIAEEHQEFQWTTYNQAKKILEFPNQLQILDKANSFIKQMKENG